jgi:hypothetical protein
MTQEKLLDELTIDPAKHFASTTEVLTRKALSTQEKRTILLAWLFDAQQLAIATDENMGGGERPRIDEINNALLNLPEVDTGHDKSSA